MDFNGDGLTDVISGSYLPGHIFLFARKSDGTFAAGEPLKLRNGSPIEVGEGSAVYAADWDGDHDLDLVIGNLMGKLYAVPNLGTPKSYAFAKPERLKVGRKPIAIGRGYACPVLADWNSDGLLDLLAGGMDGSVTFHRNIGNRYKPLLAPGVKIIAARKTESDTSSCGEFSRICVSDFNGDGGLDLLVGDFSFQKPRELTTEEQAEVAKLTREISDMSASPFLSGTRKALPELEDSTATLELIYKYDSLTNEFHGFVWLFLRPTPYGYSTGQRY